MLETYVHDANAIIFVYDVTSKKSFDAVSDWVASVHHLENIEKNKKRA